MKKNIILILLLAAAGNFYCIAARQIDSFVNTVDNPPAYEISDETKEIHKLLTIADLHSDALLMNRDLLVKNSAGHVDIPRLVEGNVAVQAFTIVSIYPFMMNTSCNIAWTDTFCCLSMMQGWPFGTHFNFKDRAEYQIAKLYETEKRSAGKFTIITTRSGLDNYLERRKIDKSITAGFIGLEGAYPLEGNVDSVEAMFDAGVRMIGMTHFADSEMAGSAHGWSGDGLSPKGKRLVILMQKKGIIIDLSHASRKTIKDILAVSVKPVVFSHTGLMGMCNNNRNITDDEIMAVAKNGGVIGIGFFGKAVCGKDITHIVNSIEYVVKLAGIDHVALGSDFDGGVSTPVDSARLVYITDALLRRGYSETDTAKIMGGNTVRVMREVLP